MKRIATALLATFAALAATHARADTRVSVGIALGDTLPRRPAPVVVAAPVCPPAPPPTVVYAPAPARGYWQNVTVKTWVPERWVMGRDRWGRPVRVCEPGYYTFRTERVWVDTAPGYAYHGWRR